MIIKIVMVIMVVILMMSNEKSVVVLSVLVIFIWKESSEKHFGWCDFFHCHCFRKKHCRGNKKTGGAGTRTSSSGG